MRMLLPPGIRRALLSSGFYDLLLGKVREPSCTCHFSDSFSLKIQYAQVPYFGVVCPEPCHSISSSNSATLIRNFYPILSSLLPKFMLIFCEEWLLTVWIALKLQYKELYKSKIILLLKLFKILKTFWEYKIEALCLVWLKEAYIRTLDNLK